MRLFKKYRITPHISKGYIVERRDTILSEWIMLDIFYSEIKAIDAVKKHRKMMKGELYSKDGLVKICRIYL